MGGPGKLIAFDFELGAGPNICGLLSRTRAIESHYIRYCIRLKLAGWLELRAGFGRGAG